MHSSTALFGLLYGVVLLAILYMLFRMMRPVQTVIIRDEPQIIPESSWWAFPMTSYNRWPYWSGWWSGGGGGGYGPRRGFEGPRGGVPRGGHGGRR
jgi:hypothetical protein